MSPYPQSFAHKKANVSTSGETSARKAEGGDLQAGRFDHRRIAIYAAWDGEEKIKDYVVYHLEQLRKVADAIIFVADNYCPDQELLKIRNIADYYICARHGELDFGSYKRGLAVAARYNLLARCREVILVNSSVFGPIYSYEKLLAAMAGSDCDFWGITDSYETRRHLQSYFLCFREAVLRNGAFLDFFKKVSGEKAYKDVVASYELELTRYFCDKGFKCAALVDFRKTSPKEYVAGNFFDPTCRPVSCMANGSPFLRRKALFTPDSHNLDGIMVTLEKLGQLSPDLCRIASAELEAGGHSPESPAFSVIMPAWNRRESICMAVDSLLGQTWRNFELIISDDGSIDGTETLVLEKYADEIAAGKIKYLRSVKNYGVSHARNAALAQAKNEWIAYLDSDNQLKPAFLETYACAIKNSPESRVFYSNIEYMHRNFVLGQRFDYTRLLNVENFIDMGGFVHHRDLYEELGGFDENLHRLVDYDLILRYTRLHTPHYINSAHVLYNDGDQERITNSVNLGLAQRMLRHRHLGIPLVATVLFADENGQVERVSLDSAVCQMGEFAHIFAICVPNASCPVRLPGQPGKGHPGLRAKMLKQGDLDEWLETCGADYIAFLSSGFRWPNPLRLKKLVEFMCLHPELEEAATSHDKCDLSYSVSSLIARPRALAACLSAGYSVREALLMLQVRVDTHGVLHSPGLAACRAGSIYEQTFSDHKAPDGCRGMAEA